jgi:hypothetical protein
VNKRFEWETDVVCYQQTGTFDAMRFFKATAVPVEQHALNSSFHDEYLDPAVGTIESVAAP